MRKKTKSLPLDTTAPRIILVGAQLGENIGTCARAMLNFGLSDLRLVAPRAGWSRDRAVKAAAGADAVIAAARVYPDLAAASADLRYIIATSARPRDMVKPILTPRRAAREMRAAGGAVGILFGPERSGLDNDAIARADALCRVPLNPDFSSLNLAQAVVLLAYEWHLADDATPPAQLPLPATRAANQAELDGMFAHLEAALDAAGFLAPPEKKPAMARNIRNMLSRAAMTEQDVRTFRGMVNALLRWPRELTGEAIKSRIAAISRGQNDPEI